MAFASEVGLESVLKQAENLVRAASSLALALDELGTIDLPPLSGGAVDQAQLRAVATLYLASELEAAGVIPAVETLVRLGRTGGLNVDLGAAAPLLQALWQGRHERATEDERLGFFSALFGTSEGPDHAEHSRNAEFEDRMLDLCEALYKLDEQATNTSWGGVAQQVRVRSSAQRLLANLVHISSGVTVFLAQEILAALKAALAVLAHPAVKAVFGARSPCEVVAAIDRLAKHPPRQCDQRASRGQAGMTLLAWLAEAAPLLDTTNKPIVGLDHPVIAAAIDWLESSLALSESAPPQAPSPTPHQAARDSSSWAALAG